MLTESILAIPDNLKGRSIYSKVIPTVCNAKNMLQKLVEVNGDYQKLKQWEKRSFDAYNISNTIIAQIMASSEAEWSDIIRNHILQTNPFELGANVIDIYLVAYISSNIGVGRDVFLRFIRDCNISQKSNSAQAIWQVGKGDGVYLNILNDSGEVKDWTFMNTWINE